MRYSISILFVLLVLAQALNKSWVLVSFKLHQQEIAQSLCEQKNKASNACQGKCQLKKALKTAEEQEQKSLPGSAKETIEFYYCNAGQCIGFIQASEPETNSVLAGVYTPSYPPSPSLEIFHPPAL